MEFLEGIFAVIIGNALCVVLWYIVPITVTALSEAIMQFIDSVSSFRISTAVPEHIDPMTCFICKNNVSSCTCPDKEW